MASPGSALQLRESKTGSLWAGYNFSVGDRLALDVTPMLGAVFGDATGIAPGLNISLAYKRVELSAQSEYVFNIDNRLTIFSIPGTN